MVVYQSCPLFIEMPAATFEEYLRLEGLERIIAIWKERSRQATPRREYFSRYAKALLTSRRASDAVTRPVGLRDRAGRRSDRAHRAVSRSAAVGRRAASRRVLSFLVRPPGLADGVGLCSYGFGAHSS